MYGLRIRYGVARPVARAAACRGGTLVSGRCSVRHRAKQRTTLSSGIQDREPSGGRWPTARRAGWSRVSAPLASVKPTLLEQPGPRAASRKPTHGLSEIVGWATASAKGPLIALRPPAMSATVPNATVIGSWHTGGCFQHAAVRKNCALRAGWRRRAAFRAVVCRRRCATDRTQRGRRPARGPPHYRRDACRSRFSRGHTVVNTCVDSPVAVDRGRSSRTASRRRRQRPAALTSPLPRSDFAVTPSPRRAAAIPHPRDRSPSRSTP